MFVLIKKAIRKIIYKGPEFKNSGNYWNKRYLKGGSSGAGSYGRLAEFKAEVINDFVENHKIKNVIEFGCGDGNQLKFMKYPNYMGFDVSRKAVEDCQLQFKEDRAKKFKLMAKYKNEQADLTLSLDVIFHLVEDHIFNEYMDRLFLSSKKYIIIYSSNQNYFKENVSRHVKHRKFSQWIVENNVPFRLIEKIKNRYPYDGSENTSFSDFYIYQKVEL